ncbi:MAG: tRNA (cytidine(34)-2'-O)-methyltransferase [Candidatus Hydrogenedentota bacterium]|nr:MAG: tRNA (cytidine(34)-2'-O)-methyltransferase [Candidatus Hydrogenedentota bacterium]
MPAIALLHPEIPQNAGNIARFSVAIGWNLYFIEPLGFSLEDRALKRAGLDYWPQVRLRIFRSEEEFLTATNARRLVFVDPLGRAPFFSFDWSPNDVLLFGRESTGLSWIGDNSVYIPMAADCRSINLSNAVAIVAYHVAQRFSDFVRWIPPKKGSIYPPAPGLDASPSGIR